MEYFCVGIFAIHILVTSYQKYWNKHTQREGQREKERENEWVSKWEREREREKYTTTENDHHSYKAQK